MRKTLFMVQCQMMMAACTQRTCAPLTDCIEDENGRFVKWRWEEGARGMRLVMIREQEFAMEGLSQFGPNVFWKTQLVFRPAWKCPLKRFEPVWHKRKIGFQETFKLHQRFLIEYDIVNLIKPDRSLLETIGNCAAWKSSIAFLAGKSFFLCGSNDGTVLQ